MAVSSRLQTRPLSPGDVVSTSFRIYRSQFKLYVGLALRGNLLLVGYWLGAIVLAMVFSLLGMAVQNRPGLILLLVLASLAPVSLLVSQGLMQLIWHMALISRLAYGELQGEQETPAAAKTALRPLRWRLLRSSILTTVILLLLNWVISAAGNIFLLLIRFNDRIDPEFAWIGFLILGGVEISLYSYLAAQYFIPELPLSLEPNLTAAQAIQRSAHLSHGSLGRILMVVSIAFIVTLPLYSLVSLPPMLGLVAIIPFVNGDNADLIQNALLTRFLPGVLLGGLLFLGINIVATGFWQATKAVVYHDLRLRREGSDLHLPQRHRFTHHPEVVIPATLPQEPPTPAQPSSQVQERATQIQACASCQSLSVEQRQTLADYLRDRQATPGDPQQRHRAKTLAQDLRRTIALKTLPQPMTHDQFLEALYWACRDM